MTSRERGNHFHRSSWRRRAAWMHFYGCSGEGWSMRRTEDRHSLLWPCFVGARKQESRCSWQFDCIDCVRFWLVKNSNTIYTSRILFFPKHFSLENKNILNQRMYPKFPCKSPYRSKCSTDIYLFLNSFALLTRFTNTYIYHWEEEFYLKLTIWKRNFS